MITAEIAENPVLEELAENGEELTPEEVQAFLETERVSQPADEAILQAANGTSSPEFDSDIPDLASESFTADGQPATQVDAAPEPEVKTDKDPFDEIDFGSFALTTKECR